MTKCSSEDAAYVLVENDYNVDQAVIAIFDRPDENVWKENKKKIKKDASEKEINHKSRRFIPGFFLLYFLINELKMYFKFYTIVQYIYIIAFFKGIAVVLIITQMKSAFS